MHLLFLSALADSADFKPWLDFFSTLGWQLIVIILLVFFRAQVASLLGRIATLDVPGAKAVFSQPSTAEAKNLASEAPPAAPAGPDGFLESSAIKDLVEKSKLIEASERVQSVLLLYATEDQRTWLVATDHRLFFVLDDDSTRSANELIQRVKRFSEIKMLRAVLETPNTGVVKIGRGEGWYYSVALHPSSDELERKIQAMIDDHI